MPALRQLLLPLRHGAADWQVLVAWPKYDGFGGEVTGVSVSATLRTCLIFPVVAWVGWVGLLCGCAGRPQTPSAPQRSLRQQWAEGWLANLGLPRVADAYRPYEGERARKARGAHFRDFTYALDAAVVEHPLSGSQLLDLLGSPNLWDVSDDGVTYLAYFYSGSDARRLACRIAIGRDGMVQGMGWDAYDKADYEGFRKWPE